MSARRNLVAHEQCAIRVSRRTRAVLSAARDRAPFRDEAAHAPANTHRVLANKRRAVNPSRGADRVPIERDVARYGFDAGAAMEVESRRARGNASRWSTTDSRDSRRPAIESRSRPR
jgi:hypothetical protein